MIPLICASTSFAIAFTSMFIAIRHSRKLRKRIEARRAELNAETQARQDRYFENERQEMARQNREHQNHMRMMRGQPPVPEMTTEMWESAKKKSRDYLLSKLDNHQRNNVMLRGFFDVTARESGNIYRLYTGSYVGNVNVLKGFGYEATFEEDSDYPRNCPRFCAHLARYGIDYPTEDHLYAQMLMLRNRESEFLAIAHRMN